MIIIKIVGIILFGFTISLFAVFWNDVLKDKEWYKKIKQNLGFTL